MSLTRIKKIESWIDFAAIDKRNIEFIFSDEELVESTRELLANRDINRYKCKKINFNPSMEQLDSILIGKDVDLLLFDDGINFEFIRSKHLQMKVKNPKAVAVIICTNAGEIHLQ